METLAEVGRCTVSRCTAGCLHLRVGDVSLRLPPEEYQQMVKAVVEAAVHLGVREALEHRLGPRPM